jgi:phage shock protein G
MFELIFILIFIGMLCFTGLTIMTVLAAFAISLVVMFLFGMIGLVFKVLPWIIVIVLGYWFFKQFVYTHR